MGSARAWETLANTMDSFAAQASSMTRHFQAKEAEEKRAQAVANKATIKAHVDSMEAEVIQSLRQSSVDHVNDFEAYTASAEGFKKGWLKSEVLDSVPGMRQAFETMVNNKIVQYSADPYKNTQEKVKSDNAASALNLVREQMEDVAHQGRKAIDYWHENESHLVNWEDNKSLIKHKENTTEKYNQLLASINNLVLEHDMSAEKAFELQEELETNYVTSVMLSHVSVLSEAHVGEADDAKAWEDLHSFATAPNRFLKKNKYLNSLMPEGYVISDDQRESIYKAVLDVWSEDQRQQKVLDDKIEKAHLADQANKVSDFVTRMAEGDETVTINVLNYARDDGDISDKDYQRLVADLQGDKYYKEDDDLILEIQTSLFDPDSDPFDIQMSILQAGFDRDIKPNTQKDLLAMLRSGKLSDVRNNPNYKFAVESIKRDMQTTGIMAQFSDPANKNITLALRALWEGVVDGQDPMELYPILVNKYKASESSQSSMNVWNPVWIGTEKNPDKNKTIAKIGEMAENGTISDSEAEQMLSDFDTWISGWELRQDRN